MGLFDRIGSSLRSIGQKISKTYRTVDKKVGGRLPGGVPRTTRTTTPTKKTTTTSTKKTTTSTRTSSGGRSSRNVVLRSPTYDTSTRTYTDAYGNKQSMSLSGALKTGAILTSSKKTPTKTPQKIPTDPRTGKPYGTVTAYQRPKGGVLSEGLGLGKAGAKLKTRREILRTKKQLSRTGNIAPLKEAELLGLTALSTVVDFGKGIVDLPETAYKIARNPRVLKDLPSAIDRGAKDFGELLRVSPGEAFIRVGGEVLLAKGTGAALNKVGSASSSQLAKLNPKYVGKAKIGQTLKIKTGAGKTVNLKVVGKIPKETLKSQVSKAGKRLNAISSQADALLKVVRRSKTVRKPIPGEAGFNKVTKNLLKQFDAGTISKKNLIKLDQLVKKQGAKGLLERAFFADPTGKIRPSRLGVTPQKKGSLLDYLTEDITFKKAKPQILLFEDIKVQKLPKALKGIGNKLKKGAALTKKEADNLLKYQLKKSGKFKPVGFISGESEITLAPGEILKRVRKVGVTVSNGRRIPIIKTEVFKPTGKVKTLLDKFNKGKLTKTQVKELDKLLKQKTGFNYGLSSAKKIAGKYVDVKKIGAGVLAKISPKKKEKITVKKIPPKYVKPKKKTPKPKPKPSPKPSPKPKPKPKKPKRKGRTSKRKPTKKPVKKPISKPVSKKPKVKKPTAKSLAASRRRKKKKAVSRPRSPPVSKRRAVSSKRPVSRVSPRRPVSKPRKAVSRVSPRKAASPKRAVSKYSPRKPVRPVSKPVKKPDTKKKKPKKKRKVTTGYYVYEKRGKKGFVKLKGKPLTKKEAKDRLAHRLDNKISRTAKLVPVKDVKKFGTIPKSQKGYYSKYKKNLRNYKRVRGKKVSTPLTFIEKKGKGVISTPGEKRQLALNRKAKAKPRTARKTVKRTVRRTVKRSPRKTTRPKTTVRRTVRKTRPTTKRTSVKRTVRKPVKRTVRKTVRKPVKRTAAKKPVRKTVRKTPTKTSRTTRKRKKR